MIIAKDCFTVGFYIRNTVTEEFPSPPSDFIES